MSPRGPLPSCCMCTWLLPLVGSQVSDEIQALTKALSALRAFYQVFFPRWVLGY